MLEVKEEKKIKRREEREKGNVYKGESMDQEREMQKDTWKENWEN